MCSSRLSNIFPKAPPQHIAASHITILTNKDAPLVPLHHPISLGQLSTWAQSNLNSRLFSPFSLTLGYIYIWGRKKAWAQHIFSSLQYSTSARHTYNQAMMRERDAEAELNLPPGFRFHPTDEELVVHYLCRKASYQTLPVPIIVEIDLYKYDPWQLPGTFTLQFVFIVVNLPQKLWVMFLTLIFVS